MKLPFKKILKVLSLFRPILRLVGVRDKSTAAKVAEAAEKLEPLVPPEKPTP